MEIIKNIFTKSNNEIKLLKLSGDSEGKNVLIIGVVHGDEPQGKFLIDDYLSLVSEKSFKPENNLYFIPCLNPDGLKLKTRQNSNGVDINRNFATKNWVLSDNDDEFFGGNAPASEIETKFVQEILNDIKFDLILTLHAPFRVVNYDGDAKKIAEKISEIIGYPVQSDIGYPTPGSFGTYSGIERKIPTITLEVDEEIDLNLLKKPVNEIFDYLAFVSI